MKRDAKDSCPWFENPVDAFNALQIDCGSERIPGPAKKIAPEDFPAFLARSGFEVEAVADLERLTTSSSQRLLFERDGLWLIVRQASLEGLAIAIGEDGKHLPASIRSILDDPSVRCWKLMQSEKQPVLKTANRQEDTLADKPLWRNFLPSRSIILPIVLATITVNLLALAIPLATMNIFDRVITNAAFGTLWALAIGVVLASGFDFLLRNLRSVLIDRVGAGSDMALTRNVFNRILGARANARVMPVGVQANALRELEGIREYFSSLTITVLGDLPFVALFLFVIAMVAGPLVYVPVLALPFVFLVVWLGQMNLRKQAESAFQDSAHKNSVAVDVASGIETIKLLGAEDWAADRWEKASSSQMRHSLAMRFWTATSVNLITFVQGVTTISLLVCGVYLVVDGQLTPGALFAANLLTARCLGPVASLATIFTRMHQMKMALDSVSQLVHMEQENNPGRTGLTPKPPSEAIVFEDVSFTYDAEAPAVLKNVNLAIRPGERIGVIGAIGSGKSTLMKLMVDFYQPTNGQILWNGIPTHHYDSTLLRKHVGSVFQSPTFFRGTIRENVVLGNPHANEQQLLGALRVSGALGWLKSQPLGLDTQIGEQGAGLSNGQRQTLAIARAFLADPSVYLFDEPTSDLDSNTERAFVERLKAIEASKTLIVVTHRPLLLEAVNRLIVIERGQVILDGEKATVLQQLREVVNEQKLKQA